MVRKDKMVLTGDEQSIISSQPTFLTKRVSGVTDWQCGDNEHSSTEKENDARSSHTAIRPTSTLKNPQ